MRIVLDANVFLSFLLGGETISTIFSLWRERKFTILCSQEIFQEVREVLVRFTQDGLIKEQERTELLWRLENESEFIFVHTKTSLSPDKKDNRYLACSIDGKADYLVTGDKKHLLPLKAVGKTRIVSPKDFILELANIP